VTVIPVMLDVWPTHAAPGVGTASLLLLPLPGNALVDEILHAVEQVTTANVYVLPLFETSATYASAMAAAIPSARVLYSTAQFDDLVAALDTSDTLLLVSPACYPANGVDLRALCDASESGLRTLRHLVGFESASQRPHEVVHSAADGRVRRIQRYFEPDARQLPVGVIASLIPVACMQAVTEFPDRSLSGLRRMLAVRGVPSRDITCNDPCVDLTDGGSLLTFVERRLNALTSMVDDRDHVAACARLLSKHATIDPSARLVGSVAVHALAVIEANALVIGPTVVGAGAHIKADAVVAQCVLLPGGVVEARDTQRHRVVGTECLEPAVLKQRRHNGVSRSAEESVDVLVAHKYLAARQRIEPFLAALMLALTAPLFALIALLIKWTSRGPVFFADRREGKNGQLFWCQKFRTMRVHAESLKPSLSSLQQMDGPHFKMSDDPRVTRMGFFLRRLNIDELPQLLNVVRGEMSLVGPRPSPFSENQICVPWRLGRLRVNPGITGLWQICRQNRAHGDFHQWIRFDLAYVRRVSLLVDVKILAATVLTMGGRWPVPLSWILGSDRSPSQRTVRLRARTRAATSR